MTPFDIHIMLHHAVSSAPFERANAPIYQERVSALVDAGLLSIDGVTYFATSKGQAYVKMICETPMPEQKLVDPRTNRVIDEVIK